MVDFGAIIGESAEWTKQVLFKPFDFKKWMVLTFIALMAGAMSNGFNFNYGGGNGSHHYESQQQKPLAANEAEGVVSASAAESKAVITIVIVAAVILIALLLLFIWLGSRFSFVFLEDVIRNDASIRAPFSANADAGDSYYKFNLVFLLIFFLVLGLLIFFGVFACMKLDLFNALNTPSPSPKAVGELLLVALPLLFVFVAVLFVLGIISLITIDFVLPIMYKENIKILAAWGKAWEIIKKNAGNFVVYTLIKIGLGIGAGIVYFLAFIIGFIAVAIPIALLVVALYFLSKALPAAAAVPYWMVVGLILTPVCLFLFYCLIAINLPFAVFFRTYGLKFLERLDPQYAFIKTEKPVAAQQ